MGILMPALARTRQLAFRMTCGTNLSGMGKAMLIYASDYGDRLPRAGSPDSTWGPVANWTASSRQAAFDMTSDGHAGKATISSCLYLLVRYVEVTPRSFICKGDTGTTEFRLSDVAHRLPASFELIDAWDFGPSGESYKHCSYSYHLPFGKDNLTISGEPGFAVAADRNPWFPSPAAAPADWAYFRPDLPGQGGTSSTARNGNALAHRSEGQNVLFLDTHVEFAKRPYCSLDDDNIYTVSGQAGGGAPMGEQPTLSSVPLNPRDSFLVHDPDTFRTAIR
jgi:hypothetical protein